MVGGARVSHGPSVLTNLRPSELCGLIQRNLDEKYSKTCGCACQNYALGFIT